MDKRGIRYIAILLIMAPSMYTNEFHPDCFLFRSTCFSFVLSLTASLTLVFCQPRRHIAHHVKSQGGREEAAGLCARNGDWEFALLRYHHCAGGRRWEWRLVASFWANRNQQITNMKSNCGPCHGKRLPACSRASRFV